MRGETEYAHVSKIWAGMGKELFTTADHYMLEISDLVPQGDPLRCLILGPLWVDAAWSIAARGTISGVRFSFGIGRTF